MCLKCSVHEQKGTTIAAYYSSSYSYLAFAFYAAIFVTRGHWMIYRGLGFLAVEGFGSSPPPPPSLPSASCISFSVLLCVVSRAYWRERGGGDGGGAKSYYGRKDWSSINHSILSGIPPLNPVDSCPIMLNTDILCRAYTRISMSECMPCCTKDKRLQYVDVETLTPNFWTKSRRKS
jgi:hypothetical protein